MRLKNDVEVEKDGVHITRKCLEGMLKASVVYNDFGMRGIRATITSILDGTHRTGSKHYEGNAFDLRTWDAELEGQLPPDEKKTLAFALKNALGNDWDIVIEQTHIHVEYDPND